MCRVSFCQLPEIQSKRFLDALPNYIPITESGAGRRSGAGDGEVITSNLRVADGSFYLGVAQPNVDGDLNSLHFTLLALLHTASRLLLDNFYHFYLFLSAKQTYIS